MREASKVILHSDLNCFYASVEMMEHPELRGTAKEKPVENEKFAFRVFLIRLGMVGDEYKSARKVLLRNLNGNSAFKNGKPMKTEVQDDE